jgi:hypothetical protein
MISSTAASLALWLATSLVFLVIPHTSLGQSGNADSSAASPKNSQKEKRQDRNKNLSFSCRVVYEPAGSVWIRDLSVNYDNKSFTSLRIDGVAVYGFAVEGTRLITHLDNERIFIDLSVPNWKSKFRDQAVGEGICVRNQG